MGEIKSPTSDGVSGGGLVGRINSNVTHYAKKVKQKNLYYYDPRQFRGAHYWERGFLSCVIAGADIPGAITVKHFKMPFNKVIFEVLYAIKCDPGPGLFAKYNLLLLLLKATGNLEKAGGEAYISEIRDMIGVPSAVYAFAVKIVELKAGVNV